MVSNPAMALPLQSRPTKEVLLPWLPFLPLLAIPFVNASPENLDRIILVMELIFVVMAIHNPLWILGALVLSEFTIRNFHLEFLLSLLIVLPHISERVDLGPRARPMVIIACSFLTLSMIAETVATDFGHGLAFVRAMFPGFIALIVIPLFIRSRRDMVQIGLVALTVAAASAVVAVLQQITGTSVVDVARNSVASAGFGDSAVDRVSPVGFANWEGRSVGLSENPMLLLSGLILVFFPLIGILLTRGVPKPGGRYLVAVLVLLGTALYFTLTRSWAYSAVAAIAVMALALGGRLRKELLILLLVGGLAFWYLADLSGSRYSVGTDNDTAAARTVLWSAGLNIALDHPFLGIGYSQFRQVSSEYADTIDPALRKHLGAGAALGRDNPHNDYLYVWLSSGIAALAMYGLMLIHSGANFLGAARRLQDPLLKGIAIGGLGALVAFAVNSFFQNLFQSTLTLWLLAGLSLALAKLAQAPECSRAEATR